MTSLTCKWMIAFASHMKWLGESLDSVQFLLVLNYYWRWWWGMYFEVVITFLVSTSNNKLIKTRVHILFKILSDKTTNFNLTFQSFPLMSDLMVLVNMHFYGRYKLVLVNICTSAGDTNTWLKSLFVSWRYKFWKWNKTSRFKICLYKKLYII